MTIQLLLFMISKINPEIIIIIANQSTILKLENKAIINRRVKIALPARINIQGSFSLLWLIKLNNQLVEDNFILSQFTSIT